MDVPVRLSDLGAMHPRLLWDEIAAATAAVLGLSPRGSPSLLVLELRDVPGFGSERLTLAIDAAGIVGSHIARVRRTYEPPRLVELVPARRGRRDGTLPWWWPRDRGRGGSRHCGRLFGRCRTPFFGGRRPVPTKRLRSRLAAEVGTPRESKGAWLLRLRGGIRKSIGPTCLCFVTCGGFNVNP